MSANHKKRNKHSRIRVGRKMEEAYRSFTRRLQGRFLYPFALIVLVAAALSWSGSAGGRGGGSNSNASLWQQDDQSPPTPPPLPTKPSSIDPVVEQSRLRSSLFAQLDNCTLPNPPPPRTTWTTKPLLVAGYTASSWFETKGEGDLIKPLIRQLTGNQNGARNYHAMASGLKRCITGSAETVTCSQGHPISPINPESQTNRFDSHVIFGIQNFAMAFAMGSSVKANRYSNTIGQMKLETWRSLRDMYMEQAFPKWKNVITTWKSLDYYNISIYLAYEHLMDSVKGPVAIQRLGKVLESAGFAVVELPNNEVAETTPAASATTTLWQCMWKKSVENAAKFQEDYIQYIPPYTANQRDFMLEQMQQFIEEMTIENDTELVAILKNYYADIRDFTPIDDENVQ